MQWQHHSSKILITGKSSSGKTTYGLRYLTHARYDYKFIFDGENNGQGSELAKRMGLRPCHSAQDLIEALPGRWVLFDPICMFSNPVAGCLFFADWVFQVCCRLPGEKLVVIDELWKYTNAAVVPAELELVVFTGRRAGLDCLFLSQRPNRIHNSIRDALSEIVCFRLQEENSLKFIKEQGLDHEAVRRLVPGEFIAWNLDTGAEERGRVF